MRAASAIVPTFRQFSHSVRKCRDESRHCRHDCPRHKGVWSEKCSLVRESRRIRAGQRYCRKAVPEVLYQVRRQFTGGNAAALIEQADDLAVAVHCDGYLDLLGETRAIRFIAIHGGVDHRTPTAKSEPRIDASRRPGARRNTYVVARGPMQPLFRIVPMVFEDGIDGGDLTLALFTELYPKASAGFSPI